MTKNLFLLFSLYFFVVQALIIGFLTGNHLFYTLGAINAGAIVIISLLYILFTKHAWEEPTKPIKKAEPEKKHTSAELVSQQQILYPLDQENQATPKHHESEMERTLTTHKSPEEKKDNLQKIVQPIPPLHKKRKKHWNGSQRWIFLITLIITIAIHFIICEFFTHRSLLLSFLIGYILFVIIGKLCSLNGFERTGNLISTRIYLLCILLAGAYAGVYVAGKGSVIEKYVPELWEFSSLPFLSGQEEVKQPEGNITTDIPVSGGDYIYEGTGEILSGSWTEAPLSGTALTGTTTSWNVITGSTIVATGTIETTQQGVSNSGTTNTITTGVLKDVTMMDAIKHVIDTNHIPLSTKTDISFTTLSKSNTNYAYFKTAYEKRMIGKNTDPTKQISCDTYMVIKGIGEGRNVGSYTDVKAAYWKKAEEVGKLNGCKKWGWVTTQTL